MTSKSNGAGAPVVLITGELSRIGRATALACASLYAASKRAVEGLTKTASLEAAPFQVPVNAVAPGPVETEMLNRFTGDTEKKAALIWPKRLQGWSAA